jgi:hypothetical protein
MLTKNSTKNTGPLLAAVLSKTRHALVALALLVIAAPPLHADTFTSCRDVTQIPEAQCNTLVVLYDNTAPEESSINFGSERRFEIKTFSLLTQLDKFIF